jgi:hypothetical protein
MDDAIGESKPNEAVSAPFLANLSLIRPSSLVESSGRLNPQLV